MRGVGLVVFAAAMGALGGGAQTPVGPPLPPKLDAAVWGMAQQPFEATVLEVHTPSAFERGRGARQRSEVQRVCRDSVGRVRTESHYDDGQLMAVVVRDPVQQTWLGMTAVTRTATLLSRPNASVPPAGRGWQVEPLAGKVIAGLAAEGFRYTRSHVPNGAAVDAPKITTVEEVWVNAQRGLVLERHFHSPEGDEEETVQSVRFTEPDQTLFVVPSDYRRVGW